MLMTVDVRWLRLMAETGRYQRLTTIEDECWLRWLGRLVETRIFWRFSTEIGKRAEQAEKSERLTKSDHSRCCEDVSIVVPKIHADAGGFVMVVEQQDAKKAFDRLDENETGDNWWFRLDDAGWCRRTCYKTGEMVDSTDDRSQMAQSGNGSDRLECATDSRRASGPSFMFKPFSFMPGWISSWYSGAGYGSSGSSGGWNGCRRGSWSDIARAATLGIGGAVQNFCRPQSRRRLRYWRQSHDEERADGCTKVWMISERLLDIDDEGDRSDGCTIWERRRDEMFKMIMESVLRDLENCENLDEVGSLWNVLCTICYADDVVLVTEIAGLCAMRKMLGYVWLSLVVQCRPTAMNGGDWWVRRLAAVWSQPKHADERSRSGYVGLTSMVSTVPPTKWICWGGLEGMAGIGDGSGGDRWLRRLVAVWWHRLVGHDDEEWRIRWFAGTRRHHQTLQRRRSSLTVDESTKDAGQEEHYGRLIWGTVGRSAGVCGSMFVYRWEHVLCDYR